MADKMLTTFDVWITAQGVKSRTRLRSVDNISLEGIARLRELILDLAVSGKLVHQTEADEPAQVTLKRQRDLSKLNLPDQVTLEIPYELPSGWMWKNFCSVLDFTGGSQPPKSLFADEKLPGYVQLIQIRDLGPNPKPVYVPSESVTKFCTASDIMIGRYGASVGKVFWGKEGAYNVALVKLIDVYSVFHSDFLFQLMLSSVGQGLFLGISRSAQDGFSKKDIESKLIPIPPLAEQHRIVAKVDELMALCDELEREETNHLNSHQLLVQTLLGTLTQAKDASDFQQAWNKLYEHFDDLFTTEDSIDQLKQTILQLAVMGKLVPQDPNAEPASELLKKIKPEMIKVSTEGRDKKLNSVTTSSEVVPPIVLPKGWACCHFDDLVDLNSGVTLGKSYKEKTVLVPYLRVANVQRGFVDTSDVKKIAVPKAEILKYQLNKGDLLMIEGGDWDKVGRCAIWGGEITPCIHQNHIFRLRLNSRLSNRFVELYLNSPVARKYFESYSKQTTNLASINKTQLKSIPVLVPPRNEQDRIVMIIDDLFALCDRLKERIAEVQKVAHQMADGLTREM